MTINELVIITSAINVEVALQSLLQILKGQGVGKSCQRIQLAPQV